MTEILGAWEHSAKIIRAHYNQPRQAFAQNCIARIRVARSMYANCKDCPRSYAQLAIHITDVPYIGAYFTSAYDYFEQFDDLPRNEDQEALPFFDSRSLQQN